jgi:hypothetical protein
LRLDYIYYKISNIKYQIEEINSWPTCKYNFKNINEIIAVKDELSMCIKLIKLMANISINICINSFCVCLDMNWNLDINNNEKKKNEKEWSELLITKNKINNSNFQ